MPAEMRQQLSQSMRRDRIEWSRRSKVTTRRKYPQKSDSALGAVGGIVALLTAAAPIPSLAYPLMVLPPAMVLLSPDGRDISRKEALPISQ